MAVGNLAPAKPDLGNGRRAAIAKLCLKTLRGIPAAPSPAQLGAGLAFQGDEDERHSRLDSSLTLAERALRHLAGLLTDKTAFVALVTLNDEGDLELVHLSDCGFTNKEIAKMLRASAKMATRDVSAVN